MVAEGYDYIIVGAGSAGCLLANRLSADPSCRVMLLEAGGSDRNFWLKLPPWLLPDHLQPALLPALSRTTEPSETTGGRAIVWPRGRVIQGGIVLDQRPDLHSRPAPRIWTIGSALVRRAGAIATCFRTSAAMSAIRAAKAGSWRARQFEVSELRTGHAASAAWVEAGVEFGLPRNPDFNGTTTLGVGAYQLGIGRHWRSSSASAFLRPVAHRPNLTVITGAQASKVVFRGHVAVGVEWIRNGQLFNSTADREVVLPAGALQSPQLLQLSGVGPAGLLRGFGIPVVADAPEVGRNLQDHYQARMIVRLKRPISLNDQIRSPPGAREDGPAMGVRRQRSAERRGGPGRRRRLHRIRRRWRARTSSST